MIESEGVNQMIITAMNIICVTKTIICGNWSSFNIICGLKYIIIASLFLYRKAKRLDRLRKTNEVSVIILSYILESGAQEQCTMENCFVKNAYFEFNNLAIKILISPYVLRKKEE